jgi:hypothetical protein
MKKWLMMKLDLSVCGNKAAKYLFAVNGVLLGK